MLSHRLEVIKCNEENNNIQLGEQTYGLHKEMSTYLYKYHVVCKITFVTKMIPLLDKPTA